MSVQESLQKKQTEKKTQTLPTFFLQYSSNPNVSLPQHPSHLFVHWVLWRHLVKEAQALVRARTFYDTNPLPHAKTMNSSPPPNHPGRMWFYMQSEPEVCADTGGGRGSLHLSPRRVGTIFFFLPAGPCARLDSPTREETIGKYW